MREVFLGGLQDEAEGDSRKAMNDLLVVVRAVSHSATLYNT